MTPTAEPLEEAIVIAALVWLALVTALLWRWCVIWRQGAADDAVQRLLVAIRLVGYSATLLMALIVLGSGVLQALSPRPASPSPWREVFQWGWLLIGTTQVTTIGVVEYLTRRAIGLLDEREASS